jgi:pyruvate/2-oxoglutarate dehydrogenase complex dihydrolipoamide acyltransferase (E2) component
MILKHTDAQVLSYAKYRRFTAAAYQSVRHRQAIHGLLEIDVSKPRAILHAYKEETGRSLSFTAFLSRCLVKAVDEHKEVQAFRQGSRRLVVFDDVDVYTVVEHDVAGEKYIVPYIIRSANLKSVEDIHHEIRAAQKANATDLLQQSPIRFVPTLLFKPFLWAFVRVGRWYPRLWKNTGGTVGISSVGMFGDGSGWGIPASTPTTLMLTVGGIGARQVIVEGQVATREYLSLTITVDHDIVDGAPAARFTTRLKELIESGYGLDDLGVKSQTCSSAPGEASQESFSPLLEYQTTGAAH